MNRSRAKELLPIIQAFAEGKDIQWQFDDEPDKSTWRAAGDIKERADCIYRIKPEPEVIYVNKPIIGKGSAYSSQYAAKGAALGTNHQYIAKKFIEVIE